ncbi:MAG: hypothetical protein V5B36_07745 [Candidatus Accumulibacter sp. UW25]|jgi:hypothetical protein
MATQGQQMLAISRYDQIGGGRDSGGDHLIVVDVARHHTLVGSTNSMIST